MERNLFSLSGESQRYNRYEARIRVLGRMLDCVRRHRAAVAVTGLLLVIAVLGFLLAVGSFTGELVCEDLVYGEAPQCSVKAFLSDVRYQFAAADGEAVWSDEMPTLPGQYRIRAVSKNGFGLPKYSGSMTFTLLQRELHVRILPGTFVYGSFSADIPRKSTELIGLANGDREQMEYAMTEDAGGNYAVSVKTLRILNSAGQDVTACYRISNTDGYFTMTPRPITVRAKDAEKVYDGEEWDLAEGALTEGSLAARDSLLISFSPAPAAVGSHPLVPQCVICDPLGEDVTSRYQISVESGTLTVLPRPITVQTGSAEKEYDDTPLTVSEWSVTEGAPVAGHTLVGTVTGTQTAVGQSSNTIDLKVVDAAGHDMSANYTLSSNPGTLTVTPITLKFETDSREAVYNGLPLTEDGCRLVSGKVLRGHKLTFRTSGKQTNVGTSRNTLSVQVRDADGNDVTAEGYRIEVDFGTLTVTPRPITITSGSAEKLYDGFPLICQSFDITAGTICHEQRNEYVRQVFFTGSQTEVGSSANTFTVEIADASDTVTTSNYDITYIYGTLTVHENPNPPEQGGAVASGGIGGTGTGTRGEDISIGYPDPSVEILYAQVDAFSALKSPEKLYFRDTSFGDYTGSGWKAAELYLTDTVSPLEYIASNLRDDIGLKIHRMNGCPALLPYYWYSYFGPTPQENDCYLTCDEQTYNLYISNRYTYQDLKDMTVDPSLELEESAYRQFVYAHYLQIPDSTKQALLDWASQHGIRADSATLVEDIQSAIINAAAYNPNGAAYPQGADVAVYFLTQAKEGVCQHFATAATLMYRAFGIPARYTVGFVDTVEDGVITELTTRDAHAWVEIYVDGLGWVAMEVTGGSASEDIKTELTIKAYSAAKIYDGKGFDQFDLAHCTIQSGSLREGHRLNVTFAISADAVAPGEYMNRIERCVVYDENGRDVTSQYTIHNNYGILTILPRKITVTLGSASKVYDGEPLTCQDYWISQGTLAPGHELAAQIDSALLDPGSTENTAAKIQILYRDYSGMLVDVTEYYDITIVPGRLEITSAETEANGT